MEGRLGIILQPQSGEKQERLEVRGTWEGEGVTCRGRQGPDEQSLGVLSREIIPGLKSNEELLAAFSGTSLGLRFGYWAKLQCKV